MQLYLSDLCNALCKVAIVALVMSLSGCYPIDTTTVYNKSWTKAYSTSEPIYLSFRNNQHASFHFKLKHNAPSKEYLLYVYWDSPTNDILFNGVKSTLKFLINGFDLIMLQPVKAPKIIAYNLETKGHQEEAIFRLTYEQLNSIAKARSVEAELTGKYIAVIGYFNRIHTLKAFRNFTSNS